jgi:hypothetical protein
MEFDDSKYNIETIGVTVDHRLLTKVTVPIGNALNTHGFFIFGNAPIDDYSNCGYLPLGEVSNNSLVCSTETRYHSCASVPTFYTSLDPNSNSTWIVNSVSNSEFDTLFPGSGGNVDFNSATWTNDTYTAFDNDTVIKQFTRPWVFGELGEYNYTRVGATNPSEIHFKPFQFYSDATYNYTERTVTYMLDMHLPTSEYYCSSVPGGVDVSVSESNGIITTSYSIAYQYLNQTAGIFSNSGVQHRVVAKVITGASTATNNDTVTLLLPSPDDTTDFYSYPAVTGNATHKRISFEIVVTYTVTGHEQVVGPRLGEAFVSGTNITTLPLYTPAGDSASILADNCYGASIVSIRPEDRSLGWIMAAPGANSPSWKNLIDFKTESNTVRDEAVCDVTNASFPVCSVAETSWDSANLQQAWTDVQNNCTATSLTAPILGHARSLCHCCWQYETNTSVCEEHCPDPRREFCANAGGDGTGFPEITQCRYVIAIETGLWAVNADGQTFVSECPSGINANLTNQYDLLLNIEECPEGDATTSTEDQCGPTPQTAVIGIPIQIKKVVYPDEILDKDVEFQVGAFVLREPLLGSGLDAPNSSYSGFLNGTSSGTWLSENAQLLEYAMCSQGLQFTHADYGVAHSPGDADSSACNSGLMNLANNKGWDTTEYQQPPLSTLAGSESKLCVGAALLDRNAWRVEDSHLYINFSTVVIQPLLRGSVGNISNISQSTINWTAFENTVIIKNRERYRGAAYDGSNLATGAPHPTLPWVDSSLAPTPTTLSGQSEKQLTGHDGFCLDLFALTVLYQNQFGEELSIVADSFNVQMTVHYVQHDPTSGRRRLLSQDISTDVLPDSWNEAQTAKHAQRVSRRLTQVDSYTSDGSSDESMDDPSDPGHTHPNCFHVHHYHHHHHHDGDHDHNSSDHHDNETHHGHEGSIHVCQYMPMAWAPFDMLNLHPHTMPIPHDIDHIHALTLSRLGLPTINVSPDIHLDQSNTQVVGAHSGNIIVSPIINIDSPNSHDADHSGDASYQHVHLPDGHKIQYYPDHPEGQRVYLYSPHGHLLYHYDDDAVTAFQIFLVIILVFFFVVLLCCWTPLHFWNWDTAPTPKKKACPSSVPSTKHLETRIEMQQSTLHHRDGWGRLH